MGALKAGDTNTDKRERRPTILVLDDDPGLADLLASLLQAEGWEVTSHSDTRKALAWLAANPPPSAILTDVMMPEMSGFEFIERIDAMAPLAGVPVIQMSAHYLEKMSPRVVAVIAKPFRLEQLIVILDRVAPATETN